MEDVIFLNPLNKEPHNKDYALREIIRMIDITEGLLKIAIAYFTYSDIATALIKRTERGRKTCLLLNTSDILRPLSLTETEIVVSENLIKLLRLNSRWLEIRTLGFRTKTAYSNMHHKFMVSSNRLIFGSLNWTRSALDNNFEVIVVSDSLRLIDNFLSEFDLLWEHSQEFISSDGKIRRIMCPICKSSEGIDFESYGPFCTFCSHQFKVV